MSDQSFSQRLIRRIRKVLFGFFAFFASIGVVVTLLFGVSVYFIVQNFKDSGMTTKITSPEVPIENSAIKIELDGALVSVSQDPREVFFAQITGADVPLSLSRLQRTLIRAAKDERVSSLAIDIKTLQSSFAVVSELRQALVRFKESGKPLYVNLLDGSTLSYYLASAADKINLPPLGGVMIPGPVLSLTYFKSALEKLGLRMEVFRAGRYKSAFEPFVEDRPSDASLEMYQDLEGSLRNHLVQHIAKSRKRTPEEVRAWLNRSVFTSKEALEAGIVDRIGYQDEWYAELEESKVYANKVDWARYYSETQDMDKQSAAAESKDEIAYIEAVGEIRMKGGRSNERLITPESMVKRLQWAKDREEVKAVVMRIDSPGGSALASDIIWHHVRELKKVKPVVVSMGSVAASGGYYIAAPASRILASETTVTGSIGVIGAALSGPGFEDKYGVSFHTVTQSDRKDYYDFAKPASSEDKKIMAAGIDEVYQTFIAKVAEGRKTDPASIDRIAQGRVYTGQRALQIGLVDAIGGLRMAFKQAKELAGLDPEKYYPMAVYKGESGNLLDCLARKQDILRCTQHLPGSFFSWQLHHPLISKVLSPAEKLAEAMEDDRYLSLWTGQISWDR